MRARRRLLGTGRALALVALAAWPAVARVGGGGGFSGGGGGGGGFSGGGGGGGGGGALDIFELLFYLLELCVDAPALGIPLVGAIVVFFVWAVYHQDPVPSYSSAAPGWHPYPTTGLDVQQLRTTDPNFSMPVFIDFVQLLYTRVAERDFGVVAAFVDGTLLEQLKSQAAASNITAVEDVIIGSSEVTSIQFDADSVLIGVAFEVNFVEVHADGLRDPLYVKARWVLRRQAGVHSLPPERMRALNCPNCGNPSELDGSGRCKACGQIVNQGKFQWQLRAASDTRGPRPPLELSLGAGSGPDATTRCSPLLSVQRRRFMTRCPDFSWPGFTAEVQRTFLALQKIWSDREWERARPFETDSLFNQHRYWMDRYLAQGLVNHLEDIAMGAIEPVKIETDAYYDAITVRIFASMKDYTTNQDGQVVGGDAKSPTSFSEYWTFIRSIGYQSKPDKAADGKPHCPNCGADLDISMTGVCKFCDSVITTGQFGWVLSMIQQDSVYRG